MKRRHRLRRVLSHGFLVLSFGITSAACGPDELRFKEGGGIDWERADLGALPPVDLDAVNETIPPDAGILGWMPDGRLVLGYDTALWYVAIPSGDVEALTLEWWMNTRYRQTWPWFPVFDVRADGARFLGLSSVPEDGDWEQGERTRRLVEYDAGTGEVVRSWTTDSVGKGIQKAFYLGDGPDIVVLSSDKGMAGAPAGNPWLRKVVDWRTFYAIDPGSPVTVLRAGDTHETLPFRVFDVTPVNREQLAAMVPEASSSLKLFGKQVWNTMGATKLMNVNVSGAPSAAGTRSRISLYGLFLNVAANDPEDHYFVHVTAIGTQSGVARMDRTRGKPEGVLPFKALKWPGIEPFAAIAVPERGIYAASSQMGYWQAKWINLDGSRRVVSLNAIVPDNAHVQFSPNGEWMAVKAVGEPLRVYRVDDLCR